VEDALRIFVVYKNPRDYPGRYVVRQYAIGHTVGSAWCFVADSLEAARTAIPPDRCRLERMPEDDPVIVETWI
jgi:hypothetical protein